MTARFVALPYSPWSEKARWALDHHRIPYRFVEHVPMLGEPLLRARARRWRGVVSVPLLVDRSEVIADSFEIAKHAERTGTGSSLFPRESDVEIARWNAASERALVAGRALVLQKVGASPAAQAEQLPPFVPDRLRGWLAPMARGGTRFLARKYVSGDVAADAYGILAGTCAMLEEAVGRKAHLLAGGLSYADIAMAVVLQCVRPPQARHLHLGQASREAWSEPELARRFAGLLEWRDALYAQRPPPGGRG